MISCWMKTVWIFNEAGAASNHLDRPEVREAFDAGEGSSHRHSASVGYETFYYAIKADNGNVIRLSQDVNT